jgi:hypothetical protein
MWAIFTIISPKRGADSIYSISTLHIRLKFINLNFIAFLFMAELRQDPLKLNGKYKKILFIKNT